MNVNKEVFCRRDELRLVIGLIMTKYIQLTSWSLHMYLLWSLQSMGRLARSRTRKSRNCPYYQC